MWDPWYFPPPPRWVITNIAAEGVLFTLQPAIAHVAQVRIGGRHVLARRDVDLASLRPEDPRRIEIRTCSWGARVPTDIHSHWTLAGSVAAMLLHSSRVPYAFDARLSFGGQDTEVVVKGATGPPLLGPRRKLRAIEHVFAFDADRVTADHGSIEDGAVFEFRRDGVTVRVHAKEGFRWCAIEPGDGHAVMLLRSDVSRELTTELRISLSHATT